MTCKNWLGMALVASALTTAGCDKKEDPPKVTQSKGGGEGEHAHGPGPNNGIVFDLGKYHAEFTVDHDKKTCTIYLLGADEKTPTAIAASELTLTTKETKTKDGKTVSPLTIKLSPVDAKDGKAMKFSGTDPALGNVADFSGTVTGVIDGKPSSGEFKE